jgi:hypothetical protein|tara:strand:+ start:155 stop:598 length:444 start_codon:yes stop_codon:yes gene_type:complete
MKKGKTARIIGFNDSKVSYGTVDSKNFKSVYLNLQSWVSPKESYEKWERIVGNFGRSIKHTVYEIADSNTFKETNIVDLDLRTSGIVHGKKSFMNLEITLFLNENMDFKSPQLKEELKKIAKAIYVDNFKNNEYFDFTMSKKVKDTI